MNFLRKLLNYEFDDWARASVGHLVGACAVLIAAGLSLIARGYFRNFPTMDGLERLIVGLFLIGILAIVLILFRVAYRLIKGLE